MAKVLGCFPVAWLLEAAVTGLAALGAVPDAEGSRFTWFGPRARSGSEVRFFSDGRNADAAPVRSPRWAMGTEFTRGAWPASAQARSTSSCSTASSAVDPYARFLPFGVDGPAEVIAPVPPAEISAGPLASKLVIYELHVGAFTTAGTYRGGDREVAGYRGARDQRRSSSCRSPRFPGARGWGYDGVAHFAPFAGYGRPEDLRELLGAAHRLGFTVLLDVVYNHFGPRGNVPGAYAPEYFVSTESAGEGTPWGPAPTSPTRECAPMSWRTVATGSSSSASMVCASTPPTRSATPHRFTWLLRELREHGGLLVLRSSPPPADRGG